MPPNCSRAAGSAQQRRGNVDAARGPFPCCGGDLLVQCRQRRHHNRLRIDLEETPQRGPRGFDVLGIDAFSGDSVPMHLITREAMALYVRHLAPDGVIVFQATNRYVDLAPVIQRLAAEQGMQARLVSDWPDSQEGIGYWMSATDQVLVTRDSKLLQHPRILEASERIAERFDLPTFTDARHNLFRILK